MPFTRPPEKHTPSPSDAITFAATGTTGRTHGNRPPTASPPLKATAVRSSATAEGDRLSGQPAPVVQST